MEANNRVGSEFVPMPSRWLNTTPVESSDRPCTLDALEVVAHVSGLHAKVGEILTIGNPNARPISTDVEIAMPDGAVVCGYGLEIEGEIRDGVVVPKEQARVVFETERRRGADPGLVESVRGNLYKTRVYPVPSNGSRRIRLDYVAPLSFGSDGQATFGLPLPAERVSKRSIRLEVDIPGCQKPAITGLREETIRNASGAWILEQNDEGVEATQPVSVGVPPIASPFVMTERDEAGDVWFCAAEAIPEQDGEAKVVPVTSIVVAWDASGSRAAADHSREVGLLRSWCDGIGDITLVTFSNAVHSVIRCESVDNLVAQLDAVRYDGGTDLSSVSQALAGIQGACDGAGNGSVCVLFSDGIDTLSGEGLSLPDGCDMLAVVSGDTHDMEGLRQACRGHAHTLESAPSDGTSLALEFSGAATLRRVAVSGTGIADVCDAGIPGSGMRVALGRVTVDATSIRLGAGGEEIRIDASDTPDGTTLSRAWAARRVALLSPQANENADELLRIGRRFGVASPITSLIVLETIDQWLRYDICPPKSWERMWNEWYWMHPGRMQESSDEERAARHLVEVERQWKELLKWWRHDYSIDGLRKSVSEATENAFAGLGGIFRSMGRARMSRMSDRDMGAAPTAVTDDFRPTPLDTIEDMPESSSFSDEWAADSEESSWNFSEVPSMLDTEAMSGMEAPVRQPAFTAPSDDAAAARTSRMSMTFARSEARVSDAETIGGPGANEPGPEVRQRAETAIRPWMPDAEYLDALERARQDGGHDAVARAYHDMRDEHASMPSFFLDCGGWLIAHDDEEMGIRVLTNLAEVSVDDAPTLRILAWRLREAGRLDSSVAILRKVLALRGEDSQSHRDLALVLSELARKAYESGNARKASECVKEAAEHYRTIALTPWQRRAVAVALFAVEEYNVMRAWVDAQKWEEKPELEPISPYLDGILDCDLRITLAWDADDTDVDIHVTEPNGEEAYYGHRRTFAGGRVSEDIRDGYGPELYEIRKAKKGEYLIRAHYFASHQQTVFGPATCTLTVYTDWGRPTQSQVITTTRLDQANQMIPVGSVSYAPDDKPEGTTGHLGSDNGDNHSDGPEYRLRIGMSIREAINTMGCHPNEMKHLERTGDEDDGTTTLTWCRSGGRAIRLLFECEALRTVTECMPGGEEMIIMQ